MRPVILLIMTTTLIGCGKSVDSLIKDLKDEEEGWKAAFRLGKIGDKKAVGPLIEALKRKSTRNNAIWSLGKLGDKRAVEPLIALLEDDEHRIGVVMALGRIGDDRAAAPVMKFLKDENETLRRESAQTLGMIGAKTAIKALRKSWEEDEDVRVRIWAAFSLVKITQEKEPFDFLVGELKDGDDGAHCASARALGLLGDVRAIEPLIRALEWAEWFRVWAHDALLEITGEKVWGTIKDLEEVHPKWVKWFRKKYDRSPESDTVTSEDGEQAHDE